MIKLHCRYCKRDTEHHDAGYLGRGPKSVHTLRCEDCGNLVDADLWRASQQAYRLQQADDV